MEKLEKLSVLSLLLSVFQPLSVYSRLIQPWFMVSVYHMQPAEEAVESVLGFDFNTTLSLRRMPRLCCCIWDCKTFDCIIHIISGIISFLFFQCSRKTRITIWKYTFSVLLCASLKCSHRFLIFFLEIMFFAFQF